MCFFVGHLPNFCALQDALLVAAGSRCLDSLAARLIKVPKGIPVVCVAATSTSGGLFKKRRG